MKYLGSKIARITINHLRLRNQQKRQSKCLPVIQRQERPLDVDNWRRRVFSKALKKAGIRRIRIHDLRHTYATLRLSKGDNIVDVANQLGDDVVTVLEVYAHWMPGKKKDEVDALDDPEYRHLDNSDKINETVTQG